MRARCRVVLTRTPEDNARLRAELTGLDAELVDYPCVAIEQLPLPSEIPSKARAGEYTTSFFISPHAVDYFFAQVDVPAPLAVIGLGTQTRERLQHYGWVPTANPSMAQLSAAIDEVESLFRLPGSVLYVCGTLFDPRLVELLRQRGHAVDVAMVYSNTSAATAPLPADDRPTLLTFASPSAVRNFVSVNRPLRPQWEALALGPTTADAAREAGLSAETAPTPRIEALAQAIRMWLARQTVET